MDECFEYLFNFNLPFLDFRIGVQGIEESFSFIISKEDQNYHAERDHISKIISLLKLSRQLKTLQITEEKENKRHLVVENIIEDHIDPQDSTLYLGRFFNSEYWKMSPYLSTIIPAFLLSSLVSIIEYDENEIRTLAQDWLYVLQHITHASKYQKTCASPLESPKSLSLASLS